MIYFPVSTDESYSAPLYNRVNRTAKFSQFALQFSCQQFLYDLVTVVKLINASEQYHLLH